MGTQTKKIVHYKAELISNSVNYTAVVENLSQDSLYMRAVPMNPVVDFPAGEAVEIKFEPVEGEKINLSCKVKWSYRTPPHGLTNSLGIEIVEGSPVYDKLMNDLD